MDTCFLFTEYLNDSGCLCLTLSTDGTLKTPAEELGFEQIKALQQDCNTILVESCTRATLLNLELPWLPERKARLAIPYALEDRIAQPVEELHFAFDKMYYHNNQYLIFVIAKQRMLYLMQKMAEQGLRFELITLDWFALEFHQLCISGSNLLINQEDFKGTLANTLAINYLKLHPLNPPLLFKNSIIEIDDKSVERSTELSYVWIAQKLLKKKPVNLCQGDMQHGETSKWLKKGYKITAALGCFWLLSVLLVNAFILSSLNKKTSELDRHIEVLYRQFFPQAKQVINPKFRISQLIKSNQEENKNRIWFLMNEFAKTMQDNPVSLQQLRYQNKTLSVTVVSPDFVTLEKLENKLRAQLKVNQTEASTHDKQVIATLELT